MNGWDAARVKAHNERVSRGQLAGKPVKTVAEALAIVSTPTNLVMTKNTDEDKLNKTERAYLNFLRACGHAWIGIQCITLKLADDTRYTPDFWFIDPNGQLVAIEVKGFMRDDAYVKVKVAARTFPWIRFFVVRKLKKNAGWDSTPVKP